MIDKDSMLKSMVQMGLISPAMASEIQKEVKVLATGRHRDSCRNCDLVSRLGEAIRLDEITFWEDLAQRSENENFDEEIKGARDDAAHWANTDGSEDFPRWLVLALRDLAEGKTPNDGKFLPVGDVTFLIEDYSKTVREEMAKRG